MRSEFIYNQPALLIGAIMLLSMGFATELGFRAGRRAQPANNDLTRAQIISLQAAVLGLLALLMGFSFSMAASRFEYRKQMVVAESNAIGTAYLRAQFLPLSLDPEINRMFQRYVEIRLNSVLDTLRNSPERQTLDAEARQLQLELWKHTNRAAEADPRSIPLGLLVHAMNELIDIKSVREIAVANHVPEVVMLMLMGLSCLVLAVVGYGNGLANSRELLSSYGYSLIVTLVILLIIDLDHPQQGLARVSQQSMNQLSQILNSNQP